MYIPNDDTQNSLFCRVQLLVETFGHWMNQSNSLKDPKVVQPTNEKTLLNTLGTSAINNLVSPYFLLI